MILFSLTKLMKSCRHIIMYVLLQALGEVVIPMERDQSMLKKAVTHLVDHVHLFTSNYKVLVILQVSRT